MHKVYLLGDSIMHIGYDTILSSVLGEEYQMFRPEAVKICYASQRKE